MQNVIIKKKKKKIQFTNTVIDSKQCCCFLSTGVGNGGGEWEGGGVFTIIFWAQSKNLIFPINCKLQTHTL